MLLFGTVWYIWISIWDIGLILNLRFFYAMASWTRILMWVLAFMYLAYYYIGLIYEFYKLFNGETWQDTVHEIFFFYVLWINTPTAIIATMYMVLLPMKTRDLGVTR